MVKYHQEYICVCNKYSVDLKYKDGIFTVTNTGTGPLCKDYILCGKYIKKSNCDKYILLPGESMEIFSTSPSSSPGSDVSIYFMIDDDNWIKSNSVNTGKKDTAVPSNGSLVSISNYSGNPPLINNTVSLFLNNISRTDLFDLNVKFHTDLDVYYRGVLVPDKTIKLNIPSQIINTNINLMFRGPKPIVPSSIVIVPVTIKSSVTNLRQDIRNTILLRY